MANSAGCPAQRGWPTTSSTPRVTILVRMLRRRPRSSGKRRWRRKRPSRRHVLGILELVFADVLPKLFGQFGPGEWVFADHCGQCGVGLHGFAKGIFEGGGFLRGRHWAV
jgi:hypothetical protein